MDPAHRARERGWVAVNTLPETQCKSCPETSTDPDDFCDVCDVCLAWCCTCVVTSEDGLLAILAASDDADDARRPEWVSTAVVVAGFVLVMVALATLGMVATAEGWFR